MSATWLDELERVLEERLTDFLRENPYQELLLHQQHQKTITKTLKGSDSNFKKKQRNFAGNSSPLPAQFGSEGLDRIELERQEPRPWPIGPINT